MGLAKPGISGGAVASPRSPWLLSPPGLPPAAFLQCGSHGKGGKCQNMDGWDKGRMLGQHACGEVPVPKCSRVPQGRVRCPMPQSGGSPKLRRSQAYALRKGCTGTSGAKLRLEAAHPTSHRSAHPLPPRRPPSLATVPQFLPKAPAAAPGPAMSPSGARGCGGLQWAASHPPCSPQEDAVRSLRGAGAADPLPRLRSR